MREQQVVDSIERQLRRAGRWHMNVHGTAHGASDGKPDFVTMDARGTLCGIEAKVPGKSPMTNQWRQLRAIARSGGRAIVAYDDFSLAALDARELPREAVDESLFDDEVESSQSRATYEVVIGGIGADALQ